jgi:hypothetical protein
MAHPEADRLADPRPGQGLGEHGNDARPVLGVHQVEHAEPDPEARGVAEHALAGGARVDDAAVGVEDGDDVGDVLQKGAQPLLVEPKAGVGLGREAALLRNARIDRDGSSVRPPTRQRPRQ